MKRTKYSLLALFAIAMMLVVSCQKEQNGKVTLGAYSEGQDKAYFDEYFNILWEEGEDVRINDQICQFTTQNTSHNGFVIRANEDENGYVALYPADMVPDWADIYGFTTSCGITLPAIQEYEEYTNGKQKVRMPMVAMTSEVDESYNQTIVGDGTQLWFHNFCSVIQVRVKNSTGDPITVNDIHIERTTSGMALHGDFDAFWGTVNGISFRSTPTIGTAGQSEGDYVDLEIGTNYQQSLADGATSTKTYSVIIPPMDEPSDFSITIRTNGGTNYTKTISNKTLPRNNIARVIVECEPPYNPPDPPDPPTPTVHYFSVGAGSYVTFSSGNLQYNPSGNHWQFAENQWSIVGSFPNGISTAYTGWIDLFTWGLDNYGTPLSTATNEIPTTFSDWGNLLRLQTELGTGWRTLTAEANAGEFYYMLNSRLHASDLHHNATVNSIPGMIILPDDWNLTGFTWANSYSGDTWTVMEDNGAIFLPIAGYRSARNSAGYSYTAGYGYYWLNGLYSSGNTRQGRCYCINNNTFDRSARGNGYSVRLVKNYTPSTSK